jgi:glutaminase
MGLPAKSGLSGGLMLVIPGKMGICIYSPLLNE